LLTTGAVSGNVVDGGTLDDAFDVDDVDFVSTFGAVADVVVFDEVDVVVASVCVLALLLKISARFALLFANHPTNIDTLHLLNMIDQLIRAKQYRCCSSVNRSGTAGTAGAGSVTTQHTRSSHYKSKSTKTQSKITFMLATCGKVVTTTNIKRVTNNKSKNLSLPVAQLTNPPNFAHIFVPFFSFRLLYYHFTFPDSIC
jgi:hypothetical protein